jgi:hypothetical protein
MIRHYYMYVPTYIWALKSRFEAYTCLNITQLVFVLSNKCYCHVYAINTDMSSIVKEEISHETRV